MNLEQIKSHAEKVIQTTKELERIEKQYHELTKEVLCGIGVNVSISSGEVIVFDRSEIQALMETKQEALEVKLLCLIREMNT